MRWDGKRFAVEYRVRHDGEEAAVFEPGDPVPVVGETLPSFTVHSLNAFGTVYENSFFHWARPGFHLMYRATMDAANAQYYRAAQTQSASQPVIARMYMLPVVPAEAVGAVNENSR